MTAPLRFTPVVIIGAGRSGTNILRDTLTRLPGFATWDCDEINPIWRHGNIFSPDDEIPTSRMTPAIRHFIRGAFTRLWKQKGCPDFVVEKTCANSLRVPFVDAALPEARYIHIVRDGVDVLASARARWQGKMEMPGTPYFLAKARYTPLKDLPIHGWSFLRSRVGLALGRTRRLATWGPRFKGMSDHDDATLEDLCAMQWAACVDRADAAFAQMDEARVLRLRYEDFTADPHAALIRIAAFLDANVSLDTIAAAVADVRVSSIGKGRARDDIPAAALDVMADPLKRHGYS